MYYEWHGLCIHVCFNVEIVSVVSPCALVCQSTETGQLAVRTGIVEDGTPCYSGTFDHAVCIEGACRVSCLTCIYIFFKIWPHR